MPDPSLSQAARPLHILLVDDDPAQEVLIRAGLTRVTRPHTLTCHLDAPACLKALTDRSVNPDVILLDINMPAMTGPEFLKRLRANPEVSHLPVVAWSSSDRSRDLQSMRKHGISGYIVKPMSLDAIIESMEALIRFWTLATPECR